MKINHLGSRNPRLHSNEILIALAITAMQNPDADRAMKELGNLKGSEAHSTIILTDEDKNVLRKLGINVTFDPYYQYDRYIVNRLKTRRTSYQVSPLFDRFRLSLKG